MARPRPSPPADPVDRLVGQSPLVAALRAQIRHLAAFDAVGSASVPTLLLYGETGTGKGLVARVVHESGPRVQGTFVEVNCAAIPETLLEAELLGFEAGAFTDARRAKAGLFEAASGGTLFLDEIDALPLALQGKLLKVIEEKRVRRLGALADRAVDVKLVAATQAELTGQVSAGRFRADLYHRLAVVVLEVPALRARGGDVLLLARHFLARYAEAHGLPPKALNEEAEAWLSAYEWPGNVRELSHLMERVMLLHPEAVVDGAALERLCLPTRGASRRPAEPGTMQPGPALPDEPARIREALLKTRGNVVRAARLLGVSRSVMRHRMRRYGIGRQGFAPAHEPRPVPSADDQAPRPAPMREAQPAEAPRWEQRPVALLAVDVTFPAARGTDGTPEEPWTAVGRWEQAIAGCVEGLGGVVLLRSPSLLTVVFGIPRALEQLPQRAIRAALAVRRLFAETAAPQEGVPGPEVRLAVHLGSVLVRVRDPLVQVLPVGDALASPVRLLGLARPGDILVSPQVGRLVEELFEIEPRELTADLGQPDQAAAYAVAGPRASRRPLKPFVGRTREMTILQSLLEQAAFGHGQVVGIVAEPGMGKSRLLAELREAVRERGVLIFEGRCLAHGSAVPYFPVLDLLRQQCGIGEADPPDVVADKVQRTLVAAGMAPDKAAPYLLRLLGVPAGTAPLANLSAEAIKVGTFETLRHLSLNTSRRTPAVVAVEDLHWVDQTSEEYLTWLVESLPRGSILLLTTYRPGYRPPWIEKSYATQLTLQPLSSEDALRLLRSVRQRTALTAALTESILDKAEGNPFFLEELARAAGDPRAPGSSVAVPETIQEVLLARIDRLPDGPRRLLQTAAVLGRAFSVSLLNAVWGGAGDARAHLPALTRLEFLMEQGAGDEPVYGFTHALTQEVAYQSLPATYRQALHAATGRALEALYADRLAEADDRLAYHYSKTAESDKAITYLTRVAERAARDFAHAEAAAALREALRHTERLPAAERAPSRVALLLPLAYSLNVLGRFKDTLDVLLRDAPCVAGIGDPRLTGPYHFMLARAYTFLGDHDGAVASAQRAIEEAVRCGDDATHGKASYILAVEECWAGRPQHGIERGKRAVDLLGATEKRFWLAVAHRALSFNYYLAGEFDLALEEEGRAHAIGEAIGDEQLKSHAIWTAGWIQATRGEWTAGIEACRQGLDRSLDPSNTAFALGLLGAAYLEQGDAAQAIAHLEQAVRQVRDLGFRRNQGWFTTFLADAYRASGRLEQARDLAYQALSLVTDAKCSPGVGWVQRALGRIALAGGALPEAERLLTSALETFAGIGARFEVGRTCLELAEVARARGERDAAARHVTEARMLFQALNVPRYLEHIERAAS